MSTGLPNFRDLGGIPTADGRRVVHGKLFRAEAPFQAQDRDWIALERLHIRLVCDLRSPAEAAIAPLPWHAAGHPPRVASLEVLPDHRTTGAGVMGSLVSDPSGAGTAAFLAANYAMMPS